MPGWINATRAVAQQKCLSSAAWTELHLAFVQADSPRCKVHSMDHKHPLVATNRSPGNVSPAESMCRRAFSRKKAAQRAKRMAGMGLEAFPKDTVIKPSSNTALAVATRERVERARCGALILTAPLTPSIRKLLQRGQKSTKRSATAGN